MLFEDTKVTFVKYDQNLRFKYEEKDWFKKALEPDESFWDTMGDFINIDPKDYKLRNDKKYFYFHACAYLQRKTVCKMIELKKINKGDYYI